VRADLNVPVKDGRVTDATRIERFAPTVTDLTMRGAKVVVLSHFDRPKGKRVPSMSLAPLAPVLGKLLGKDVAFADDCIGPAATLVIEKLNDGDVALLENLRYHNGEEANDAAFVKDLAALGDIYVNDAFSAAHRAHAAAAHPVHALVADPTGPAPEHVEQPSAAHAAGPAHHHFLGHQARQGGRIHAVAEAQEAADVLTEGLAGKALQTKAQDAALGHGGRGEAEALHHRPCPGACRAVRDPEVP